MTTAASSTNKMKLALCQISVTTSKEANLASARKHLLEAADNGATVAVLPECWNCPYGSSFFPEYAEILPDVGGVGDSPSAKMLREVAVETGMTIVGGSVPEKCEDDESGNIYNTSLTYLASGEVAAKHRKVHLFDVCVPGGISFRESETLSPGNSLTNFRIGNVGVGVGICYDVRFPELSMLCARESDVKLLVFPGAFNMTTGPAHWELLLRARALDNQVYVAACSPARKNADEKGYTAWGHSSVVDPWGTVIATTEEKEAIVYAEVDFDKVDSIRKAIPTSMQRRNDIYQLSKV